MADAQVRLANPEGQLLGEIADPTMTVRDVTQAYALALLDQDAVRWPVVNRAIIARWSMAALDRVKRDAWKRLEARRG